MKEALIVFVAILLGALLIKVLVMLIIFYVHKKKCGGKIIQSDLVDSGGNIALECEKCHKVFW